MSGNPPCLVSSALSLFLLSRLSSLSLQEKKEMTGTRRSRSIGDEPEEESCCNYHWSVWLLLVIFGFLIVSANVISSVALAEAVANDNESFAETTSSLNFTGLGGHYLSLTATYRVRQGLVILRLPPASATCTANSSRATSTGAVLYPPLVKQELPIRILSSLVSAPGYMNIAATTGIVTIRGTGDDFGIGTCGWTSDMVVQYLAY